MSSDPKSHLSDAELRRLNDLLQAVDGSLVPNIEAIDGFLTAAAVGPDLILPMDLFEFLFPKATETQKSSFRSASEASLCFLLTFRLAMDISSSFQNKQDRPPLFLPDAQGAVRGNHWAQGFLTGTLLRSEAWSKLAAQEEHVLHFLPIWALAYEHATHPELRPVAETIPAKQRHAYLEALPQSAHAFCDLFAQHRANPTQQPTLGDLPRRGSKVG
jgi:yecA family protein